ncbi:LURP-one-related/scramblase family protein [Flavobacterium sp. '19STA2R22 D10 B1']|uniref:LURP-one-related/scramblase family protein n=1 Tax=Flavobacterium aerium TaxID=3037261 RepID=UPI00278BCEC8|nr:phospholipid scramblase-related protein [Flavobacterium sp. '19STA2R22 D10 B1']
MTTNFFDSNSYFIDEKVNMFKFANEYKVFDNKGTQIGAIKQRLTTGQKMLRLVVSKAMLPFHLEIVNEKDQVQASINRGWTFFMSSIIISDYKGAKIAEIKQKFKLFKPRFIINDKNSRLIAEINGDWKAWNFNITDPQQKPVGQISKKWAGAMKEIFTTADKYNVTIEEAYPETDHKAAIVSCAICIDMILKENNS